MAGNIGGSTRQAAAFRLLGTAHRHMERHMALLGVGGIPLGMTGPLIK